MSVFYFGSFFKGLLENDAYFLKEIEFAFFANGLLAVLTSKNVFIRIL